MDMTKTLRYTAWDAMTSFSIVQDCVTTGRLKWIFLYVKNVKVNGAII